MTECARTVTHAAILMACSLLHVPAGAAEQSLSVEETIGVVFIRLHEGVLWNLYKNAHKDAKGALYRILAHKESERYHENAWRVLGYIGDAADVKKLEHAALNSYTGVLKGPEGRAMSALFDSLGLMSFRGIREAESTLKRMTTLDYWKNSKFQWDPDEILKKHPGLEYATISHVVDGYALSGSKDLKEMVQSILSRIKDPKTREYVAARIDPVRLAKAAERVRLAEKEPMNPRWRKRAVRSYEERVPVIVKRPEQESRLREEDAAFIKAAVRQAHAEFEKAKSDITKGNFKVLAGRLLDDGKMIDEKKLKHVWPELETDMAREQQVFESLAERESTPVDYRVHRIVSYQAASISTAQDAEIHVSKAEEISVSFRLSGTTEIGNVLFRRQRGSLTIAADGSLIVFMKKINGRWYWNPFGW